MKTFFKPIKHKTCLCCTIQGLGVVGMAVKNLLAASECQTVITERKMAGSLVEETGPAENNAGRCMKRTDIISCGITVFFCSEALVGVELKVGGDLGGAAFVLQSSKRLQRSVFAGIVEVLHEKRHIECVFEPFIRILGRRMLAHWLYGRNIGDRGYGGRDKKAGKTKEKSGRKRPTRVYSSCPDCIR